MGYKDKVLLREPKARLIKEDLQCNGLFYYNVRIGETNKWLGSAGFHSSPRAAWEGAWYYLQRRETK